MSPKPDAKEDGNVSHPEAAQPLVDFVPTKKYFVGIDSDGCAMDAMDIKHQECVSPRYIKSGPATDLDVGPARIS